MVTPIAHLKDTQHSVSHRDDVARLKCKIQHLLLSPHLTVVQSDPELSRTWLNDRDHCGANVLNAGEFVHDAKRK